MDSARRQELVGRYRNAIAPDDAARQPFYGALVLELSRSEVALELLGEVPTEHRNPMLILAALHYHALGGHELLEPLYDSLRSEQRPTPEFFASTVRAIVEAHPELVRGQLHRTTQTNEVGRSAVIRAVLRELQRHGVSDVNLLDVGASAGLNLYPDYYPVSSVAVEDPLTLFCESLNELDIPGPLPAIHRRVGLDLNPLDLNNSDDVRWLNACLWPEDASRLRRLRAIEELVPTWPAITLLRGGVLETLDAALATIDNDHPTVVMHTWVAAYFPEPLQEQFAARMRELTSQREIFWLYAEWPSAVRALAPPPPNEPAPQAGACQIVLTGPGLLPAPWGWCHAHGRWLSLSPTSGPKA